MLFLLELLERFESQVAQPPFDPALLLDRIDVAKLEKILFLNLGSSPPAAAPAEPVAESALPISRCYPSRRS